MPGAQANKASSRVDSTPPHSPEAEQGLLGAVLLASPNDPAVTDVLDRLGADAFYSPRHRIIWSAIQRLHLAGFTPELVAVTDTLRQTGHLDDAGGAVYLTGLLQATFSPVMAGQYATILARDWGKRTLLELGGYLGHHAANGQSLDALLAFTDRTLENVRGLGFDSPTPRECSDGKRIWTAAELLETNEQGQVWYRLWGQAGLLGPGCVCLLSGHSKQAGKSTSTAIGLRDILRSDPTLSVFALSEEPKSKWVQRFHAWKLTPPGLFLRFADGSSWKTYLREIEQGTPDGPYSVVFVDTLRSFGGFDDENDASGVVRVLQPPVVLARRLNIAVLYSHHLRKSEGSSGLAHSGSTALVALADVALEMHEDKAHAPNRRILRAVSRFDETPREFVLELRGQEIVCLGSPDALTLTEVSQRVLAVLSGAGKRITRDDVLDGLDDPRPSSEQIARALKTLLGQGRVSRKGRGVRGDPHLWEIESTTKPPFSRGIELNESDRAPNA